MAGLHDHRRRRNRRRTAARPSMAIKHAPTAHAHLPNLTRLRRLMPSPGSSSHAATLPPFSSSTAPEACLLPFAAILSPALFPRSPRLKTELASLQGCVSRRLRFLVSASSSRTNSRLSFQPCSVPGPTTSPPASPPSLSTPALAPSFQNSAPQNPSTSPLLPRLLLPRMVDEQHGSP